MYVTKGADVAISIEEKLSGIIVSESPHCCIFRVHNVLRNVNEKAYEPEMISIGPYHRGKPHLQMMEQHKLRFLKLLLQRKNHKVSEYMAAMKQLEEKARLCYAEFIRLSSDEFVEMMVLDGCFIIELLRKFNKMLNSSWDVNDPLFRMEWTLNLLQRDLMLFENQLPFFILNRLYEMVELPGQQSQFIHLALDFFNDLFPGHGRYRKIGDSQDNIKHLLDLIHRNWSTLRLQPNNDGRWNMENIDLIRSSTELEEGAGIKFEKIENEVSFDIVFKNGSLRIPAITIEDRTECFLRNLIAYEQHCGDNDFNIVTDYMTFFGCLIKSVEDVNRLCGQGIIRSFVSDNEAICGMFSTMNKCITGPSRNFHYAEIFSNVNRHYERRMNKWITSLRRKYMHSPWGIISIMAASTLLILTLLQVIFQILSWKHP